MLTDGLYLNNNNNNSNNNNNNNKDRKTERKGEKDKKKERQKSRHTDLETCKKTDTQTKKYIFIYIAWIFDTRMTNVKKPYNGYMAENLQKKHFM